MLNFILTMLPAAALPLVVTICGLLIMIGIVKPRTALGVIGLFVLSIAAAPFIEEWFADQPVWVPVVITLCLVVWAVRTLMEFMLGERAAGHVMAAAVIGLFRLTFSFTGWITRFTASAVSSASRMLVRGSHAAWEAWRLRQASSSKTVE